VAAGVAMASGLPLETEQLDRIAAWVDETRGSREARFAGFVYHDQGRAADSAAPVFCYARRGERTVFDAAKSGATTRVGAQLVLVLNRGPVIR